MRGQAEQLKSGESLTLLIFHHENWKDYTPMYAECNLYLGPVPVEPEIAV